MTPFDILCKKHDDAIKALQAAKDVVVKSVVKREGFPKSCGICGKPLELWNEGSRVPFSPPVECDCTRGKFEEVERLRTEVEKQRNINDLRRNAFYDRAFEWMRFENDNGKNIKLSQIAKSYAEQFETFESEGVGLLLYGDVGTGKTFSAACIVNALIDRGIPCLFTDIRTFANELQDSKNKNGLLNALRKYRLVVIDDLSSERETGYTSEVAYSIVNRRELTKMPLIVTTNLTGDELKGRGDITKGRIFDRICRVCKPVFVEGKSQRADFLRKNNERFNAMLGL